MTAVLSMSMVTAITLLVVFCATGISWERLIIPVTSGTSRPTTASGGGGRKAKWLESCRTWGWLHDHWRDHLTGATDFPKVLLWQGQWQMSHHYLITAACHPTTYNSLARITLDRHMVSTCAFINIQMDHQRRCTRAIHYRWTGACLQK